MHKEKQQEKLTLAVRVYPTTKSKQRDASRERKPRKMPKSMLVLDTETRTDESQRLTFGSYRYIVKGNCLEEGIFHADDLPAKDLEVLRKYIAKHPVAVARNGNPTLLLLTRREFVKRFFKFAYKERCLVVGFNLPFDLSRIAFDFKSARGRFAGGFALELATYINAEGHERPNPHRPRMGIKHIDSKRALKGFTGCLNPDPVDLIPDSSATGEPQKGYKFRGHFLDLRMLAFALTDRGYTLEQACEAFGVKHGKQKHDKHGDVTPGYIDYNRRDVEATYELAVKLLEEYGKHPIALQPTKAYSPASIGKSYLEGMGIKSILSRQPDFPKQFLGYAASAFFGGRTSAHLRKIFIPVVYTDFLSMYPTVNSLMDLWPLVIARRIRVVENCQDEVRGFLAVINRDVLFEPATWRKLLGFVRIIPEGDILPSRGKYSGSSNDYQVAVNHLYDETEAKDGLWFSLPDVVASVLLTGRVPKIVDVFRLEPEGVMPGLKPIKLRGEIMVDSRSQDFFKTVIEERKRLRSHKGLSDYERARLDKALKVLANATSYGIYAEMNRRESDEKVKVTCYGIDPEPFTCSVEHPEEPGEYCFPPMAALITGGARLMLALLEECIDDLGGTYAMEDTDSMAIVATKSGGMVPCPDGRHRTKDGKASVKALSWKQAAEISDRFKSLNPYAHDAIPGSILKIEADNFDPVSGKQRQLYCYAISAKRYALFARDRKGIATLLRSGANNTEDRWSEHGLGHLLNPSDPESEDREWIAQAWLGIVRRGLELTTETPPFAERPAVGRVAISSPKVMRALAGFNEGKLYAAKVKPFNFLLACHVKQLGHPTGTDPERFHLIAPYESDPRRWLKMNWIDQYTGNQYRITTAENHGSRKTARVKTYGEVLREYEYHPEAKCADADGKICDKQTIGLLQRRHVHVDLIKFVGKESNHLEDVDAGLIHSEQSVYTEYPDSQRSEWNTKVLPALRKVSRSDLQTHSGMSRSALIEILAGRSVPHTQNQKRLVEVVRKLGLI
jgi:hypothetical protein